jgi:ribosomal protein L29
MNQIERVTAVEFIRKLRGGSSPVLVRTSDGNYYVVKFGNNPQGPNVLFNEALGSEVYRGCGLPTADWCPVWVPGNFIQRNHGCRMSTSYGWRKPTAGWCFGSKVLTVEPGCLYDFLPASEYVRVANRGDFWTAWVLDVLCGHTDIRQALFLKLRSGRFQAFFIDHGHLFGGPDGLLRGFHFLEPSQFIRPRYMNPEIYMQPAQRDVDNVVRTIQQLDVEKLAKVVRSLPKEWKKELAVYRFDLFREQVSNPTRIRSIAQYVLGSADHAGRLYGKRRKPIRNETKYADLCP